MKVKLAAQVLSHSVAGGMFAKMSTGDLTAGAVVTANVINNTDKLFDCLNSDSSYLKRGKPLQSVGQPSNIQKDCLSNDIDSEYEDDEVDLSVECIKCNN